MKKSLLIAVCAVFSLAASAQRASSSSTSFFSTEKAEQPVKFTIRGGVNFAGQTFSLGSASESYSRTGWNVGLAVDLPIVESFYLQTGLFATSKGYKIEETEDDETYTHTANPLYLEVPVLASYRYNFDDATQLEINVGPYFAFGIAGNEKEEYETSTKIYTDEIDYFSDKNETNTFDVGLQIGAGITFVKHIYLGAAYEFGFSNVWKNSGDGKVKNHNFMLNLGYKF